MVDFWEQVSIWASLSLVPARLTLSPSTSPSQPPLRRGAMVSLRFLTRHWRESLTSLCSRLTVVARALGGANVATSRCHLMNSLVPGCAHFSLVASRQAATAKAFVPLAHRPELRRPQRSTLAGIARGVAPDAEGDQRDARPQLDLFVLRQARIARVSWVGHAGLVRRQPSITSTVPGCLGRGISLVTWHPQQCSAAVTTMILENLGQRQSTADI